MQMTLVLFALGVATGLSLGHRIAVKEVEMMFRSAKREIVPRNRVWECIKFQNAYNELKSNLNISRRWEGSKNRLKVNRIWESTERDLIFYDMKALQTWNDVNIAMRRRKRELSSKYLISN